MLLLQYQACMQVEVKLPVISAQGADLGMHESKLEALCKAEDVLFKAWRPALTDEEAVQKEVYAAACTSGAIQVAWSTDVGPRIIPKISACFTEEACAKTFSVVQP